MFVELKLHNFKSIIEIFILNLKVKTYHDIIETI